MDLTKQYNNVANDFLANHDIGENSNRLNREHFYSHIDFLTPGTKLLDLACGDGTDLVYYKSLGAEIYGLDASELLIDAAHQKLPGEKIEVGLFEQIPYEDDFFDAVLSKYAIMTSSDMRPVFKEIHRVLKPGGTMLYLVTHPFRQFFEKKDQSADYFEQTIVDSLILNGSLTVQEPSHTMGEFLNDFLFTNFDVQAYDEKWDPAAEQIDGKRYPGYFILKAKKRS
ncbi:MAG: ubiquinone/menaquinone biosynthesis methyltransferase [Candidatus Berkelbacteria bacterium Gr01-1014_85]|uniref:Ubiquinone/menaquinone biosynthesis methyltransferase n=1 Tax=Candidatus Berkelbacteria bacterium Gr01-1014_85 TaxID=2017150 RepID=A0A554JA92_9BACT|nr:MAG: ubiquinone/menaquinone biosynthesis methyltransferase [Candidatus Berkelbacteria bacterium Gr01-1014_85]